jgi:hypothetical protein
MLVQVVILRHEGRKLTATEVRTAQVHTGRIMVTREPGGKLGSWARAAYFEVDKDRCITLHNVQITRWDARGIVLMGFERHWNRKHSRAFPQSWWCRPVSIAATPASGMDPIDADEEREHLLEAGAND